MKKNFDLSKFPDPTTMDELSDKFSEVLKGVREFSINLTPEERRAARNVGPQRYAYARQVLEASQAHINYLPRDIDPEPYEDAFNAFDRLRKFMLLTREMQELLEDTRVAIGSQIMYFTDNSYKALQAARSRDAAIDGVMEELETYNERSKREELTTNAEETESED